MQPQEQFSSLKKKKNDPQINKTEQEQSSGRATKLLV